MSEIQELKSLLQQHMKESAEDRMEIKSSIARIEVHNEYTQKKLESVNTRVDRHEADKNKALGVLSLIGVSFTALFSWLFKHL